MAIYARAVPKAIHLTETYCYEKYISTNESLEPAEKPQGKIEVIIPYDGQEYFGQRAIQDVAQQITSRNGEINALIGHLAMSHYDNTNLDNLLSQNQKYETIPLQIPVFNNTISHLSKLKEDKHLCLLSHEYHPDLPEFKPINVEIEILDDYHLLLNEYEELTSLDRFGKIDQRNPTKIIEIAQSIRTQVKSGFSGNNNSLKGKLFIFIKIQIFIDFSSIGLSDEFRLTKYPQVKQLSIEWPTITSFRAFDLKHIYKNKTLAENIRYNSLNKSFEWFAKSDVNGKDIPLVMQRNVNSSRNHRQNYEILMLMGIVQPGELYQETNLRGTIEVEIPELLLSGLQARFYGFSNNQVGRANLEMTQLKTRIITNFQLDINEAFKKRTRSTAQELIFENVLSNEDNLRIILRVLNSQGFSYQYKDLYDSNSNRTLWLITAERQEGIEKMTLWMVIDGEEKTTVVKDTKGNVEEQTGDKKGQVKMYFLGSLPRNSYTLIRRMNALQEELRQKLG
ncbi:MAG: hypothetical protein QNJ33_04620 [Crocosphaera sp.]|nr:hypothetical protein [Crocosphaera sp.]